MDLTRDTEALGYLEEAWDMPPPRGAGDLGAGERYLRVLVALRDRLCPKLKDLSENLKSDEAALVAGLVDVLGPIASGNPIIVGSLFRMIVAYGIDRFCESPEGALDAAALPAGRED